MGRLSLQIVLLVTICNCWKLSTINLSLFSYIVSKGNMLSMASRSVGLLEMMLTTLIKLYKHISVMIWSRWWKNRLFSVTNSMSILSMMLKLDLEMANLLLLPYNLCKNMSMLQKRYWWSWKLKLNRKKIWIFWGN